MIYKHYKNGSEYDFLGIGSFTVMDDTLAQIGTALFSEDPATKISVYRSADALALYCIAGVLDKSLEYVIYQARYSELGSRVIWARPKGMFYERVDFNGESVPRFRQIA